jgi:hypothetical protein
MNIYTVISIIFISILGLLIYCFISEKGYEEPENGTIINYPDPDEK